MKFFTDRTVENEYLLVKLVDYMKMKDFSQWKEVFIDPGVYDLVSSDEYFWFNKMWDHGMYDWIKNLPEDHYFSFDYPCDMNEKFTDLFLEKSWNNALKYHNLSQYIVTVQSKFNHYWSFKEWFDRYNDLDIASGIMGVGNICRIHYKTPYIKHCLPYAFKNCRHPRIHIYGLALRIIPYAYQLAKRYGIELSIDSTKWTRPFWRCCYQHGLSRQELFDRYKEEIHSRINHQGIGGSVEE